jgi:hypothetical protein
MESQEQHFMSVNTGESLFRIKEAAFCPVRYALLAPCCGTFYRFAKVKITGSPFR